LLRIAIVLRHLLFHEGVQGRAGLGVKVSLTNRSSRCLTVIPSRRCSRSGAGGSIRRDRK
jgi:hypothetical protein